MENTFSAKGKRDLCLLYIQIHKCKKDKKTLLFIKVCTTEIKEVNIEGKTFLELLTNDPLVYSGYKYRSRIKLKYILFVDACTAERKAIMI
jgi:hypothetical protein